jgi:hypothetical protein
MSIEIALQEMLVDLIADANIPHANIGYGQSIEDAAFPSLSYIITAKEKISFWSTAIDDAHWKLNVEFTTCHLGAALVMTASQELENALLLINVGDTYSTETFLVTPWNIVTILQPPDPDFGDETPVWTALTTAEFTYTKDQP